MNGDPPLFSLPSPSLSSAPLSTEALAAASAQGVSGASTTPFVLKHVADATGGASLASNVALVLNNAQVGAQVAVALAELRRAATREK